MKFYKVLKFFWPGKTSKVSSVWAAVVDYVKQGIILNHVNFHLVLIIKLNAVAVFALIFHIPASISN